MDKENTMTKFKFGGSKRDIARFAAGEPSNGPRPKNRRRV